jgi:hypothetical protein
VIFPPAALSVALNGAILRSYNAPVLKNGRILAPIDPYVLRFASSIGYSGGLMVITRGDRFVQLRMQPQAPQNLQVIYVQLAPLLRTLGVQIAYDAALRRVNIETPPPLLVLPTPFNAAVPRVAPHVVFTPAPASTPRPHVSGSPQPRRTPLEIDTPSSVGHMRVFEPCAVTRRGPSPKSRRKRSRPLASGIAPSATVRAGVFPRGV